MHCFTGLSDLKETDHSLIHPHVITNLHFVILFQTAELFPIQAQFIVTMAVKLQNHAMKYPIILTRRNVIRFQVHLSKKNFFFLQPIRRACGRGSLCKRFAKHTSFNLIKICDFNII